MLNGMSHVPRSMTHKTARVGIDTLIMLKQAIRLAEDLAQAVASSSALRPQQNRPSHHHHHHQQQQQPQAASAAPLMAAILNTLKDAGFARLDELIKRTLVESTAFSKNSLEMKHQECFAILAGVSGLLDVSRKTFLESVEDIYSTAERYQAQLQRPVKVAHSNNRGYYLQISCGGDDDDEPLPEEFIQQARTGAAASDYDPHSTPPSPPLPPL